MSNKKYNLLPYETIVKAAAGEPEAVNTVIQTYTGYIKASLMEALPKFHFDR